MHCFITVNCMKPERKEICKIPKNNVPNALWADGFLSFSIDLPWFLALIVMHRAGSVLFHERVSALRATLYSSTEGHVWPGCFPKNSKWKKKHLTACVGINRLFNLTSSFHASLVFWRERMPSKQIKWRENCNVSQQTDLSRKNAKARRGSLPPFT